MFTMCRFVNRPSLFFSKDNFESVPESVRGLVIDITMDVELFSEFERSDICMKHLKLIVCIYNYINIS